jgi:hypothetical protein
MIIARMIANSMSGFMAYVGDLILSIGSIDLTTLQGRNGDGDHSDEGRTKFDSYYDILKTTLLILGLINGIIMVAYATEVIIKVVTKIIPVTTVVVTALDVILGVLFAVLAVLVTTLGSVLINRNQIPLTDLLNFHGQGQVILTISVELLTFFGDMIMFFGQFSLLLSVKDYTVLNLLSKGVLSASLSLFSFVLSSMALLNTVLPIEVNLVLQIFALVLWFAALVKKIIGEADNAMKVLFIPTYVTRLLNNIVFAAGVVFTPINFGLFIADLINKQE